ncbi:MAG: bifunctional DNA-formamidopyrimidine glycosylase/DNA-(apurinic or apyrimidinic site) lyase [Chloroflexi bacterium]|nr:bifunctional DNA-formamidopyrimidine glycosylase/DNA-(apurinic or apyrimidinic site) lyase [Chloroflexota bacterium]
MPELPEVEVIARALRQGGRGAPAIRGARVREARVLWPRTVAEPTPAAFQSLWPGRTIVDVGRRGKFLRLYLDDGWHALVHLRMSGDLVVQPAGVALPRHARLYLDLDDGRRLVFNDPRKFGRWWLTRDPAAVLGHLGPEPLDPAFTPAILAQRLRGRRARIKALLLDQRVLAGVGNIYADEALHRAGLHPLRRAASLTAAEITALWRALRAVLQEGIARNGTSIDWMYQGGAYQQHLRVYGRHGQVCYTCGERIQRLRVAQRSTHFCPRCQPRPAE